VIYVQLQPEGPIILMDEDALVKTEGQVDDDVEFTTWVEYRLRSDPTGRAVHRSVHVTLKKPAVFADGAVGGVG
jgi:hypothetical protein